MKNNTQKIIGISLILIGLVAAVYILMRSLLFPIDESESSGTSSIVAGDIVPPQLTAENVGLEEYPARLIIPKINVDAFVQHVGVKENGDMANPTNFTDVGWYREGIVPGYSGSAVMAGHVDNALALDGVFKELPTLEAGDEIYVESRNGERHFFKVEKVEIYDYKKAPTRKIFISDDGLTRLNLITCAGTWLQDERSYSQRVVVYAVLDE